MVSFQCIYRLEKHGFLSKRYLFQLCGMLFCRFDLNIQSSKEPTERKVLRFLHIPFCMKVLKNVLLGVCVCVAPGKIPFKTLSRL